MVHHGQQMRRLAVVDALEGHERAVLLDPAGATPG